MSNHGSSPKIVRYQRRLLLIFYIFSFIIVHSLSKELGKDSIDFRTSVVNGMYVDKSLLISELLERDEKVFQITRPRRWGKTMNLNMIKTFFEVEADEDGKPLSEEEKKNSVLFRGGDLKHADGKKVIEPLKISEAKSAMKTMGKHPVVYLNMGRVKGNSVNEIGANLNKVVVDLYKSYPFLVKYLDNETTILDEDEIPRLDNFLKGNLEKEYIFDSLEFLCMMLFEHFESYVCLLIDDYDVPLVNAFTAFGQRSEFDYVVKMLTRFYEYSFKENQYLLKGVVMGTLSFDVIPSGLGEFDYNYILYDTMFDEPFSKYFGFTETEVGKLIQNVHQMDSLKEWYGGIFINKTEIYNPGSVVGFLQKQEFDYFLLHSQSDVVEFANKGFFSQQSRDFLLLCGESRETVINEYAKTVSLQHVAKDFHSVFVNLGYLNLITPKRYAKEEIWRVTIPNIETKGIFAAGFQLWVAAKLNMTENESRTLSSLLLQHKLEEFATTLETYLSRLKYDFHTDENKYHDLMAAIFASLAVGYRVNMIRQVGSLQGEGEVIPLRGFGNVVIHAEYNVCTSRQKVENMVDESLRDLLLRPASCTGKNRRQEHVEKVLYVAVGFSGHRVLVRSKLVDL